MRHWIARGVDFDRSMARLASASSVLEDMPSGPHDTITRLRTRCPTTPIGKQAALITMAGRIRTLLVLLVWASEVHCAVVVSRQRCAAPVHHGSATLHWANGPRTPSSPLGFGARLAGVDVALLDTPQGLISVARRASGSNRRARGQEGPLPRLFPSSACQRTCSPRLPLRVVASIAVFARLRHALPALVQIIDAALTTMLTISDNKAVS